MNLPTDEKTLFLKRTFKASPKDVFDAFTSIDAMAQWFGPEGCQVTGGEMDFTVGGNYRLEVDIGETEKTNLVGTFKEIDRPNTLRYTWKWDDNVCSDDNTDTNVLITLIAVEGETELTLEHTGFPDAEICGKHEHGWNGSLDKMARVFS